MEERDQLLAEIKARTTSWVNAVQENTDLRAQLNEALRVIQDDEATQSKWGVYECDYVESLETRLSSVVDALDKINRGDDWRDATKFEEAYLEIQAKLEKVEAESELRRCFMDADKETIVKLRAALSHYRKEAIEVTEK